MPAVAAAPLSWSAPQQLIAGGALAGSNKLGPVSCASESLCVAGDAGEAQLAVGGDPSGAGAGWQIVSVEEGFHLDPGGIDAVACPSSSLCVAGAQAGLVVADPTGGKASSQVVTEVLGVAEWAVSCASSAFCVAFDGADLYVSTDPDGGPAAWASMGPVGAVAGSVSSVSCVSASLCVALDSEGDPVVSSNPAGGASAWTAAGIRSAARSVSCPSSSLCVAVGGSSVLVSSDPAGMAASWAMSVLPVHGGALTNVSCGSSSLCVAAGTDGVLARSAVPSGGAAAWSVSRVDRGRSLVGVSCPSASFCLAVDSYGDALASHSPAGGGDTWTASRVTGEVHLDGVSCPVAGLCVAVDSNGEVLSSTHPLLGTSSWHAASVSRVDLEGVTCPSERLCVAWSSNRLEISTHPAGGTGSWHSAAIGGGRSVDAVSCASTNICLAIAGGDSVYASADPAAGSRSRWRLVAANVHHTERLLSLSCPSLHLCVAGDEVAHAGAYPLLVSSHPTSPGSWSALNLEQVEARRPLLQRNLISSVAAVDCTSASFCEALMGTGVVYSTDPAGGARDWRIHAGLEFGSHSTLSCVSASVCVSVEGEGSESRSGGEDALVIDGPPERASSYSDQAIDRAGHRLNAVSCAPTGMCVAVDNVASVIVGDRRRSLGPDRHRPGE
jgi:hypothetical protein